MTATTVPGEEETVARGMLGRYRTATIAMEMAHWHAMDHAEGSEGRARWLRIRTMIERLHKKQGDTSMKDRIPSQLTPEECAADPTRVQLNAAKQAAHRRLRRVQARAGAPRRSDRQEGLPVRGDPRSGPDRARASHQGSRRALHMALVRETEW